MDVTYCCSVDRSLFCCGAVGRAWVVIAEKVSIDGCAQSRNSFSAPFMQYIKIAFIMESLRYGLEAALDIGRCYTAAVLLLSFM